MFKYERIQRCSCAYPFPAYRIKRTENGKTRVIGAIIDPDGKKPKLRLYRPIEMEEIYLITLAFTNYRLGLENQTGGSL